MSRVIADEGAGKLQRMPRTAWALGAIAVVVLAAVGAMILMNQLRTEVQVASGSTPAGSWSLWTYEAFNRGTCLQIRAPDRDAETLCGLTADPVQVWRPDAPPGSDAFLVVIAGDSRVAAARITLAGEPAVADAKVGHEVSALRYIVFVLPAGMDSELLEVLNVSGVVIETVQLE